jgi:hypothetical protein
MTTVTAMEPRAAVETATANRRGPRKRMVLQALVSGTMRDVDGRRWEVIAGQTQLTPDHAVFQANPDLRRYFELVDANEQMRAANRRRVRRALSRPSTQPAKRTPRRTKYSIPD